MARLIGLIGGMSWESSALYYRLLNQAMQRRLGGHHNAASVMVTLEFEPLLQAGAAGRWDEVADAIAQAGMRLKRAGAEFFLLTANTAHNFASQVQAAVDLPLLHIGTPTVAALQAAGIARAGLIGTRHVTGPGAYRDWYRSQGIELVPPPDDDRAALDAIIADELTQGRIDPRSRQRVLAIVDGMRLAGLQAVVIGCTELPLLLEGAALPLAGYDTTRLHAEAAVALALDEDGGFD
ncbi:Aspartate racemase [Pigmentiphaga humi]|uniref:Aspartate racemase n=1 Tax=Pigmentiphaga humi TaxID=2478468 RepID=A0A3P4AYB0_9BURK|nr:amino acid racemase [Pigmentiphaga humi]VCU68420.1 Aspartate racemase [Pigmentiphaga humi]